MFDWGYSIRGGFLLLVECLTRSWSLEEQCKAKHTKFVQIPKTHINQTISRNTRTHTHTHNTILKSSKVI